MGTLGWVSLILFAAIYYTVPRLYDREIYTLLHGVSGHTLKHLAAAGGVYLLLHALRRRTLVSPVRGMSSVQGVAYDLPAGGES